MVGLFWTYQAFQVFKQAYNEMHGQMMGQRQGGASGQSFLYQQPQDRGQQQQQNRYQGYNGNSSALYGRDPEANRQRQ